MSARARPESPGGAGWHRAGCKRVAPALLRRCSSVGPLGSPWVALGLPLSFGGAFGRTMAFRTRPGGAISARLPAQSRVGERNASCWPLFATSDRIPCSITVTQ